MKTEHGLELAATMAIYRKDKRAFRLGAVAKRADGTIVTAANGSAPERSPAAHAEARLARKLDKGAIVYIARVLKSGEVAMARPCLSCRQMLRSRGVRTVYYTVGPNEFGTLKLKAR